MLRLENGRIFSSLLLISCFLFFYVLGYIHLSLFEDGIERDESTLLDLSNFRENYVFSGQVIQMPLPSKKGAKLLVAVHRLHTILSDREVSGKMLLFVQGVSPQYIYPGDLIRFSASLKPFRNFKTPGAFDQEGYWKLRKVLVRGFVRSPVFFEVLGHAKNSPYLPYPLYLIEKARSYISGRMREYLGPSSYPVAMALVLGERAWMDPAQKELFSKAGLGHLMAVSGLHMALIALFIGYSSRRLLLLSQRIALRINVYKVSVSLAALGTLIYAGLAGFSPSAVRATVMILAFCMAFMWDRKQTSLNSLAISAWILLVIKPLYIFDVSFQLSFVSVLFLILAIPFFQYINGHGVGPDKKKLKRSFQLIAVTIVATGATLPLISLYFQRVSLISLPMNFCFTPVFSFLVIPFLLGGVTMLPVSDSVASLFLKISNELLDWTMYSIGFIGQFDWVSAWVSRKEAMILFSIYFLLGGMLVFFFTAKKRWPAPFSPCHWCGF